MDLVFSRDLEPFRREVRAFFETEFPRDLLDKQRAGVILTREDQVRNQMALQSRGWLAPAWPEAWGGAGWDAERRYIFEEEADRAGAPMLLPMGIIYVAPVIYSFGSEAQKRRWLPDILASRKFWAQGYSEPEAGSDLAALQMTAVRDGDDYVLNGTKIWTSYGHWADWIFCLARTSRAVRRQDGISFICAEMASPGITVHPIITIDGVHHLNQIDFQDVRVPVDQRIGEEGRGWQYATYLLQGERLSYAHVAGKREQLNLLRRLAAIAPADDLPSMLDAPHFVTRLADCAIAVETLGISVLRVLTAREAASAAEVSALKIVATQTAQRISELFIELAGHPGATFADRSRADWANTMPLVPDFAAPAMAAYLFERAQTIYGGATEVQKNIVWRSLAGH